MASIVISKKQYLECLNLYQGSFNPVKEFMNQEEINSVAKKMILPNKKIFPLPIFFDVSKKNIKNFESKDTVSLIFNKKEVGFLKPKDIFICNKKEVAKKVYGFAENNHLGVKKFYDTGEFFVSGKVKIFKKKEIDFLNLDHTPNKIKKIIKQNKWKTTIGFQTRNIPHLGHEFIHRRMLDKYDGLIINPLVGERKKNDFTIRAIVKSYKTLINKFYPKKRILFFLLTTNMRFAGPREAIFHAIVRKNFGCTHFLIGRDHAGVDNFYGDYDAHKLAKKIDKKININIVKFKGPFFCKKCKMVTNEDNCSHFRDKKSVIEISGTKIRKSLKNKNFDNCRFLRKEVLNSIKKLKLFI